MTAITWVAPEIGGHATTAQFRVWVADFRDRLLSVGLIQTDDTGQLDPETVEAPSGAAQLGKFVFRFNDSLQDAAPVFFSVNFYKIANGAHRQLSYWIEVGTSTDGASNIQGRLGQIVGPQNSNLSSSSSNNDTSVNAVQSWATHSEGFVGFVVSPRNWGGTNQRNFGITLFVARTTNADGTPTADGVFILGPPSPGAYNSNTYSGNPIQAYSSVDDFSLTGLSLMGTPYRVGDDIQLQRVFLPAGGLKNVPQLLIYPSSAVDKGTEFEAISAGTTPSNFVALPGFVSGFRLGHWNTSAWALAMRFE